MVRHIGLQDLLSEKKPSKEGKKLSQFIANVFSIFQFIGTLDILFVGQVPIFPKDFEDI